MEDVLNWIPADVKLQILQVWQANNLAGHSKDRFFKVVKTVEGETYNGYKKKQYLGYEVLPAQSIEMLHPVLVMSVRLEITEHEVADRLKRAIKRHMRQPSASIQKIYSYTSQKDKQNKMKVLSLCCEIYRLSLGDVIRAVGAKTVEKISLKLANYVFSFLFVAYRSILDLLADPNNDDQAITVSFSLKNILFDRFYSLILGNPFYGNCKQPSLLIIDNNSTSGRYIKPVLRQQIGQILDILQANCRTSFPAQNPKVQALVHSKDESVDISEQLKTVQQILSVSLMEFPDQQIIEELKTAEKQIQQFSKLAQFHFQQNQRNKNCLKHLADHGSYPPPPNQLTTATTEL